MIVKSRTGNHETAEFKCTIILNPYFIDDNNSHCLNILWTEIIYGIPESILFE